MNGKSEQRYIEEDSHEKTVEADAISFHGEAYAVVTETDEYGLEDVTVFKL